MNWTRVVMYQEAEWLIKDAFGAKPLHVCEVSSANDSPWSGMLHVPGGSYKCTKFPDYDLTDGPLPGGPYDLVILDNILEHVTFPSLALHNIDASLSVGGCVFVATPFLIRVHPSPDDLWRWTRSGLNRLLEITGFREIKTGSWGNRQCVEANLIHWQPFKPDIHSLENDPLLPVQVWALAKGGP